MLVRYKPTGQLGTIPDDRFDASLFEMADEEEELRKRNASTPSVSKDSFVENVIGSGIKNAKDIGSSLLNVVNPNMEKNTIANIGRLGVDTVKLIGGDEEEDNRARLLGQFYKDRYGGVENIKKTLYEDPVGALLDASVVLGGGGATLKGAGTLSKSAKLSRAGQTLADVSKVIDPIQQTSKLISPKIKAGMSKAGDVTEGARTSASKSLAGRSIKANASQRDVFSDLTGKNIDDWMVEKNIRSMKDVEPQIAIAQKQYNDLVRTGKKISGDVYAKALEKQASELISSDRSQTARLVASKLRQEAKIQRKMGDITDTILTNTKSGEYSKVSKKAMVDPVMESFNQRAGSAGIEALESIAPGSKLIGKELQALQQFKKIVKRQDELGKGTQVFNLFKSGVGGFTAGGVAGSVLPGVGTLTGAAAGVVGQGLANSPMVQRGLSKALVASPKISPSMKNLARPLYPLGKTSSRLSPQELSTESQPELATQENTYNDILSQNSGIVNGQTTATSQTQEQPILSPEGQWRWDASVNDWVPNEQSQSGIPSVEKLQQAYVLAFQAGDTKAMSQIKTAMDFLHPEGKQTSLSDKAIENIKDLEGGLTGIQSIRSSIEREGAQTGPFAGLRAINPYDTDAQSLQAEIDRVRQKVGKALEGGVLRKEDEEKYKKILATMRNTEEVNLNKLSQLEMALKEDLQRYIQLQSAYGKGASQNTTFQTDSLPDLELGF